MWDLNYEEGGKPKNCCIQTVVLEKTLEGPLVSKELKSMNPKGNQSWIFIRKTDSEPTVPILWPPDSKNWLSGKDFASRKDWRPEEEGAREDEMVGWHHRLDRHEFEQTAGNSEEQGSLVCCSSWGHKISDNLVISTKWLNNISIPNLTKSDEFGTHYGDTIIE